MDLDKLLTQYKNLHASVFAEGILDDQFTQLQQLQDPDNPDFVSEVVGIFFEDSERILGQLTEMLYRNPVDYKVVDGLVHQFKGSSASIGAIRIKTVCIQFRTLCEKGDLAGCRGALEATRRELALVKSKLESLMKLEKSIVAAGGAVPGV